ncbi:MAG: hypothetical protein K2X01_02115 [Cyanobacteria bacterium]|nr:hypothetical protein [Cyanobacteriota bacterium]
MEPNLTKDVLIPVMKAPSTKQMIFNSVLMLSAVFMAFFSSVHAANGNQPGQLVLFSADWSASSQVITPIVQAIATEKQLSLTVIDVDKSQAPKQASRFGLEIPRGDIPQIYWIRGGVPMSVYSPNEALSDEPEQMKQKILSRLR